MRAWLICFAMAAATNAGNAADNYTVRPQTGAQFANAARSYQIGYWNGFIDANFSHSQYHSGADVNHFTNCISGSAAPTFGQIIDAVNNHITQNPSLLIEPATRAMWATLYRMCGMPPSVPR